jgi:hypothetical protein
LTLTADNRVIKSRKIDIDEAMMVGINLNAIQNMVVNNEIIENRNGSVVPHSDIIGTAAASSPTAGEYCWVRLKLNTCLSRVIKIKMWFD